MCGPDTVLMDNLQEPLLLNKETSIGSTSISKRPKSIIYWEVTMSSFNYSHSFPLLCCSLLRLQHAVVWLCSEENLVNSSAWLFSHHLTVFVEQHLRKKSCKISPYKLLIDFKKERLKRASVTFPPYKTRIETLILPIPQESKAHWKWLQDFPTYEKENEYKSVPVEYCTLLKMASRTVYTV